MELLQHGVDQSVIALWLGHESVETTQVYIHADLRLKEKALSRIAAPASSRSSVDHCPHHELGRMLTPKVGRRQS